MSTFIHDVISSPQYSDDGKSNSLLHEIHLTEHKVDVYEDEYVTTSQLVGVFECLSHEPVKELSLNIDITLDTWREEGFVSEEIDHCPFKVKRLLVNLLSSCRGAEHLDGGDVDCGVELDLDGSGPHDLVSVVADVSQHVLEVEIFKEYLTDVLGVDSLEYFLLCEPLYLEVGQLAVFSLNR